MNEAMEDMYALAADELKRTGMNGAIASELAAKVISRLAAGFQGETVYFPTSAAMTRSERDQAIRKLHDGTRGGQWGTRALARIMGVTEVHIYRILAASRRQAGTAAHGGPR